MRANHDAKLHLFLLTTKSTNAQTQPTQATTTALSFKISLFT